MSRYKLCKCAGRPADTKELNFYSILMCFIESIAVLCLIIFNEQHIYRQYIHDPVHHMLKDCNVSDFYSMNDYGILKKKYETALHEFSNLQRIKNYTMNDSPDSSIQLQHELRKLYNSMNYQKELHVKCVISYLNTRIENLNDILNAESYLIYSICILHIPTVIACFKKKYTRALCDLSWVLFGISFALLISWQTYDQKTSLQFILKAPKNFLWNNKLYIEKLKSF